VACMVITQVNITNSHTAIYVIRVILVYLPSVSLNSILSVTICVCNVYSSANFVYVSSISQRLE